MRNTTIPISHHRCGIRALIQIHQTERGLLALSVVQALLKLHFHISSCMIRLGLSIWS